MAAEIHVEVVGVGPLEIGQHGDVQLNDLKKISKGFRYKLFNQNMKEWGALSRPMVKKLH